MDERKRQWLEKKRRQRRQKVLWIQGILIGIIVILFVICVGVMFLLFWGKEGVADDVGGKVCSTADGKNGETGQKEGTGSEQDEADEILDETMQKLKYFADANQISMSDYPKELIELLRKNSETEEFVWNYPLRKGNYSTGNLTEPLNGEEIPLIMQWDARWGYFVYGDNVMGLTGCGPTCLSMVASYLLKDPRLTPLYMAQYAIDNGYCVAGNGTAWDFMLTGARSLGLNAKEVPLHENTVKQYLQAGKPIICIMGKGIFTDSGHFIVFSGWKDGKIEIKDPNSREKSEMLWEFQEIQGQIKNMWVYTR